MKKIFNYYLMDNFYYFSEFNKKYSDRKNFNKHSRKIKYNIIINSKNNNFRIYKKNMIFEKKFNKHNQNLFSEKNILIKNDGSISENNLINRQYFKRLKKYYPIY